MVERDIKNLMIRIERLKKHLEKNKHDYKSKRALQIKISRLNKLKKYQKRRLKRKAKI